MVVRTHLGCRMTAFYLWFLEVVPVAVMILHGLVSPVTGCDHMTPKMFVFPPNSHHCSLSIF